MRKGNKRTGGLIAGHPTSNPGGFPLGAGIVDTPFTTYSVTEGLAFLPYGTVSGFFNMTGVVGEQFKIAFGTPWEQEQLVKMFNLGYANTYTVADVYLYLQDVMALLQTVHTVHNMFRLQNNLDFHRGTVFNETLGPALNGQLKLTLQRAIKVLEACNYPPKFYNMIKPLMQGTRMAKNPNSAVRLITPTRNPFVITYGNGYVAADINSDLLSLISALTTTLTNAQLANILPFPKLKLDLMEGPFEVNYDVINFLLNMSFRDGVNVDPNVGLDDGRLIFYRDHLSLNSLLAISGTEFNVYENVIGGPHYRNCHYFDTTGASADPRASQPAFNVFGNVWEANATVYSAQGPSISQVIGTNRGVLIALAKELFSE